MSRPVESKVIESRGKSMPPRKRSTQAGSAAAPALSKKERVLMMSRYLGTYFAYKAYAVVRECTLPTVRVQKNGRVSIDRWEKVRADLIAINHKHQTVIVETKSCPSDFRSDEKWESYLPLCNKFYFAADPKTAEYIRAAIVERKMKGVGSSPWKRSIGCGFLKTFVSFARRAPTTVCSSPPKFSGTWP